MKKNLFFTFIFSFIPGAGQMYQGYMKRGLSIALIAFSFIMLNIFLDVALFVIPFLIIMMYSFFDTYNLRNDNTKLDDYILLNNIYNNRENIFKNKYIAYALILLGCYLIFDNIILDVISSSNILYRYQYLVSIIRDMLPSAIVAAIAIILGFKFLRKD